MSQVHGVVQSFLNGEEPPSEETAHTFYLTLKGRAQLDTLAQISKRSKTRTGSQILAAALQDAINALPDEPFLLGKFGSNGDRNHEMYTPEQFVCSTLADWEEIESLEAQGLWGNDAGERVEQPVKGKGKK
jgi:hypothetical protein